MTEEKKSAEETLRKAREQQGPKPADAPNLEELRDQMGADKVEVVDNDGNVMESTEEAKTELEQARQKIANLQDARVKAAQEQRLQGLVSGKIPPPNEMVAYCVKKIRDTRTEYTAVQNNIRELSVRLQQLRERTFVLQGENNKYLEDIKNWDKPEETKKDPVPEKPDGKGE